MASKANGTCARLSHKKPTTIQSKRPVPHVESRTSAASIVQEMIHEQLIVRRILLNTRLFPKPTLHFWILDGAWFQKWCPSSLLSFFSPANVFRRNRNRSTSDKFVTVSLGPGLYTTTDVPKPACGPHVIRSLRPASLIRPASLMRKTPGQYGASLTPEPTAMSPWSFSTQSTKLPSFAKSPINDVTSQMNFTGLPSIEQICRMIISYKAAHRTGCLCAYVAFRWFLQVFGGSKQFSIPFTDVGGLWRGFSYRSKLPRSALCTMSSNILCSSLLFS